MKTKTKIAMAILVSFAVCIWASPSRADTSQLDGWNRAVKGYERCMSVKSRILMGGNKMLIRTMEKIYCQPPGPKPVPTPPAPVEAPEEPVVIT